jgi:GNAT superfamily N-acetyltransferase
VLAICPAADADLPLLARMNRHLADDEGSRNRMSADALAERMRGWLHGDWHIDVITEGDATLGYTVYQIRPDEYEPERAIVYVRQFFIERERRGQGLGRHAFMLLMQTRFPQECTIALDVLAANPDGARFWASLGFQPYCTTLHLAHDGGAGE